jgi:transcription-repair coupling factor (superfamily II helicase)
MGLSGILDIVQESPTYQGALATLASASNGAGPLHITVPDAARSYLIACLCRDLHRTVLLITAKPGDADRLSDELATIFSGTDGTADDSSFQVLRLPESEALPYERLAEDAAVSHGRLRVLSALLEQQGKNSTPSASKSSQKTDSHKEKGQGLALVGSVAALAQRMLRPNEFEDATHDLAIGQHVQIGPLLAQWSAMGYVLEATVEVPGTASRRGGILDIFPPSESQPVRIELFGDTIEDIRPFDPLTQRSSPTIHHITISPALDHRGTLGLDGARIADTAGMDALLEQLGAVQQTNEPLQRMQEDLERLRSGEVIDEAGFYAGFLCDGSVTDYLPADTVIVTVEPDRVSQEAEELSNQAATLREAKIARNELPESFPSPWWPWSVVEEHVNNHSAKLHLNWLTSAEDRTAGGGLTVTPSTSFWGKLDAFATAVGHRTREGARVVILSNHAERLQEVLEDYGVGAKLWIDLDEAPEVGSVALVAAPLPEGMTLELPSGALTVFTDNEVFGHSKRRRSLRKHAQRREAFLTELIPGTYVVHVDHGIGQFTGVRMVSGEHGEHEYLTLEYAEGDKLFVPSEHLDRLSPYLAPGDSSPTLTRLGSQEWAKAKERARTSAKEMAGELVALYAARQVLPGHAFSPDTVWQREMEDAFPFTETRDQLEAIDAVKDAMEAPHPMDHLICGDVGYGKTEIAIRAAFKAAQDGMQVAMLCPTTVLAQQHYTSFTDRLSPYPVRVEVLSRFRTPQEQQEVIKDLREGKVDILIGTHRILQKDVQFKNLGLVVVDDEQRFGVVHKERFKQLRREVDVLTLTATPIPRTLSMALAGVRDMTTVHTPPESRLPVRTFVSDYEDSIVQEAVLRELDRGGQVFFLHNRIRTIHEWANRIQELVPQAKVAVGHGRMDEDELSGVMNSFMDGKADVLVSTTIIEAGLDLPNANTIIVHRPELLGLAQMYQLRGRVGRGNRHAYAYFLVPPGTRMTEAAQKRLKAIVAYQELGAGFRIAMKDLEIRGAGNILGPEQSGLVHAVGFDLYTRLLEEAVADLKAQDNGESPVRRVDPPQVAVDLPMEAFIPEDYIEDLPTRLGAYQRLARAADTEEAVIIGEELRDRFGPTPEAVDNLVYVVRIKVLAGAADVETVIREGSMIAIRLRHGVGGARALLQKDLGTVAQVGDSLVRLPLKGQWTEILAWVLERMASFRERMIEMAEAAEQAQS